MSLYGKPVSSVRTINNFQTADSLTLPLESSSQRIGDLFRQDLQLRPDFSTNSLMMEELDAPLPLFSRTPSPEPFLVNLTGRLSPFSSPGGLVESFFVFHRPDSRNERFSFLDKFRCIPDRIFSGKKQYFFEALGVADLIYKNKTLLNAINDSEFDYFRNFITAFYEFGLLRSGRDQRDITMRLETHFDVRRMKEDTFKNMLCMRSLLLADLFKIYFNLLLSLGTVASLNEERPGENRLPSISEDLTKYIAFCKEEESRQINGMNREFFNECVRVAGVVKGIITKIEGAYQAQRRAISTRSSPDSAPVPGTIRILVD